MKVAAAQIEALARAAGFDLCGFAPPERIPAHILGDWLESGMCADMDWMKERAADRLDVTRLLPEAKTVVALAANYYWWDPSSEPSPISRYARGRDYHQTMRDRLRTLRRTLREKFPGMDDYAAVDFGPVMERVWAVRAGLGFVGKNGCLITREYGSWVFLATMVLNAEVDAYAPDRVADSCGSCSLCISACPTDAITLDRRVDARLCLSYQTIENEDAVPEVLRPALRDIVFGCDICQDVCPLNAAPVPTGNPRFAPRAVAQLGVRELAALTPEQYQALIPGTPLGRAKYDGLRRNAAYALGAMRDAGAAAVLTQLLDDPSGNVRDAASWALEQLARPR